MKKIFSWIFAVAIASILSFTFTSCSKDEDYSSSDIVGEWYLSSEKGYYYSNDERQDFEDSYSKSNTWLHWTFASDGTGVAKNTEIQSDPLFFYLTWSMSGSKLTIKDVSSKETDVCTIEQLTSSTLKVQMKGTDEDGSYEYNYTFAKVK